MALEAIRFGHENLERLEAGIAERVLEQPVNPRDRIQLDHDIADLVNQYHDQSEKLLQLYRDPDRTRDVELQSITADPAEFAKRQNNIKDHHHKYPGQTVDKLEQAYKRRPPGDNELGSFSVDSMFTGEEAYGRFMDLVLFHEQYLNLPGMGTGRRVNYQNYVSSTFDSFAQPDAPKRSDKLSDQYFNYVAGLAEYLETFLKKTKPLQDNEQLVRSWDEDFEKAWTEGRAPQWTAESKDLTADGGPETEGSGTGVWCSACKKEFGNQNTYQSHLTGNKHKKAAKALEEKETAKTNGVTNGMSSMKEKAIAAKEWRITKLASAMQTRRHDTVTNIDRKAGLTEKERQAELQALYTDIAASAAGPQGEGSDDEDGERVYNPLKLPLAWDGKPIPYWLYKLHGLGQEFKCEICGNYIYMGRRAYERHFNEARHVWGLRALGIPSSSLFHQISEIEPAQNLWKKIQHNRQDKSAQNNNIVECEDSAGNTMPEAVYNDLVKQGLV